METNYSYDINQMLLGMVCIWMAWPQWFLDFGNIILNSIFLLVYIANDTVFIMILIMRRTASILITLEKRSCNTQGKGKSGEVM